MNQFYLLLLLACGIFSNSIYCMEETSAKFHDKAHNVIHQIALARGRVIIASGSHIMMWDLKSHTLMHDLDNCEYIYQLVVDKDKIIAFSERFAQRWAIDSGKKMDRFRHSMPELLPGQLQLLLGNKLISRGPESEYAVVFDQAVSSVLFCLVGHKNGIYSMGGNKDRAITGSYDKTAKVWNLNDGSCIATLTGHADPVGCVALAGNKALTSDCFTIKIWNIDDSKCVRTLKPCGGPWALALSRKYVAAGFSQGQVQVWSER